MEKQELLMDYVNAIYQNINAGTQSIEDILPKIEDDAFKKVVAEIQSDYMALAKECELFAKSENIKGIKGNNWFEKARMWMSVNMSTMSDKSKGILIFRSKTRRENIVQTYIIAFQLLGKCDFDQQK